MKKTKHIAKPRQIKDLNKLLDKMVKWGWLEKKEFIKPVGGMKNQKKMLKLLEKAAQEGVFKQKKTKQEKLERLISRSINSFITVDDGGDEIIDEEEFQSMKEHLTSKLEQFISDLLKEERSEVIDIIKNQKVRGISDWGSGFNAAMDTIIDILKTK